jgi:hypothetical protein
VIFVGLIAVAGVDIAVRQIKGPPPGSPQALVKEPEGDRIKPDFDVGQVAPDFTLADSAGVKHSLSSLVKGDTLLSFICGCRNCEEHHQYLSVLRKKKGDKIPPVLFVASMEPAAEKKFLRDTGSSPIATLYETAEPKVVMETYRGHPCPRDYRLDGDRKVRWISGSMIATQGLVAPISMELASILGFAPPGTKPAEAAGKPIAPLPQMGPGAPKPAGAQVDNTLGVPISADLPPLAMPPAQKGSSSAPKHPGHDH